MEQGFKPGVHDALAGAAPPAGDTADEALTGAGDAPADELETELSREDAGVEIMEELKAFLEEKLTDLHNRLADVEQQLVDAGLREIASKLDVLEAKVQQVGLGDGDADAVALAHHAIAVARAVANALSRATGVDVDATIPPAPGVAPASSTLQTVGAEVAG